MPNEKSAPAQVHVLIMGHPLCTRQPVARCNYDSQEAALDALVAAGIWSRLPYGTHLTFAAGCCQHGVDWRDVPAKA